MSLIKSVGGSNPAAPGAGQDTKTGGSSPALCGFTEMSSPAEPAKSNSEISTIKDAGSSLAPQEGTSLKAYKSQKGDVSGISGS